MLVSSRPDDITKNYRNQANVDTNMKEHVNSQGSSHITFTSRRIGISLGNVLVMCRSTGLRYYGKNNTSYGGTADASEQCGDWGGNGQRGKSN